MSANRAPRTMNESTMMGSRSPSATRYPGGQQRVAAHGGALIRCLLTFGMMLMMMMMPVSATSSSTTNSPTDLWSGRRISCTRRTRTMHPSTWWLSSSSSFRSSVAVAEDSWFTPRAGQLCPRSSLLRIRGGAAGYGDARASSSPPWTSRPRVIIQPTSSSSSTNSARPPVSSRSPGEALGPDQDHAASNRAVREMIDAFLTRDSRNTFIARVYAILAAQLSVTAGSVYLFGTVPSLAAWMRTPHRYGGGQYVAILSLLVSTISWLLMSQSPDARRQAPWKWWGLVAFTAGEALSVGFLSSFYRYTSVVSAMLATAVATVAISVYTARQNQAKYDLSQWGAGLSSCGVIFLIFGVIQLLQLLGLIPADFLPVNDMLYSLAGACLFSFYLAYHTKLIVGGKHTKYQMNEQDYVLGAMSLYNDIINIFFYTLRLMGEERDHDGDGKH